MVAASLVLRARQLNLYRSGLRADKSADYCCGMMPRRARREHWKDGVALENWCWSEDIRMWRLKKYQPRNPPDESTRELFKDYSPEKVFAEGLARKRVADAIANGTYRREEHEEAEVEEQEVASHSRRKAAPKTEREVDFARRTFAAWSKGA